MKNKHILAIFILGVLITIVGALFKITHWDLGVLSANSILIVGMTIKIFAGILFITKLLGTNSEFLNK